MTSADVLNLLIGKDCHNVQDICKTFIDLLYEVEILSAEPYDLCIEIWKGHEGDDDFESLQLHFNPYEGTLRINCWPDAPIQATSTFNRWTYCK